jgi:hypothetical protein
MNNTAQFLGLFFGSIALVALAAIILAWPTQLLWNGCLVPAVNGLHEIGFWQALGINFLFSMLFKTTAKSSTKKD